MANILEFRQGPRAAGQQRNGSTAPAEIVFFPGVRYERWEEAPQPEKSKKRARSRDSINLND